MKPANLIFIVTSFFVFSITGACQQPSFIKYIRGTEGEHLSKAVKVEDDGLLLVGDTYSHGDLNSFVIRTDDQGEILWSFVTGQQEWDEIRDVAERPDGGWDIVGVNQPLEEARFIFHVRLSANGELQFIRRISSGYPFVPYAATARTGGGLFITGICANELQETYFFIMALTDGGVVEWVKLAADMGGIARSRLVATADGGLIMLGATVGMSLFMIKLSSDGEIDWVTDGLPTSNTSARLSPLLDDGSLFLMLIEDGDFIFRKVDPFGYAFDPVAWRFADPTLSGSGWDVNVDDAGNLLVTGGAYAGSQGKGFGLILPPNGSSATASVYDADTLHSYYVSVMPMEGGGYMLAGNVYPDATSFTNSVLSLIRTDGTQMGLWSPCQYSPVSLIPTVPPSTIAHGQFSFMDGPALTVNDLVWDVTSGFDELTVCTTVGVKEQQPNRVKVRPNPGPGMFYFDNVDHLMDIEIFDLTGRSILHQRLQQGLFVDLRSAIPGMYACRLTDKIGQVQHVMLVKE